MKSSLKLFCIVLMSAGLLLPACEKQEATDEAAVEVAAEEGALEEEAAEEVEAVEEVAEEEAVEGDVTEEAAGDATAAEGDAAAAEEAPAEEAQKEKPKPATPALVGRVKGAFGGSGVKGGQLELTVTKDYKVTGRISGEKEGVNFRIPFSGTLSKSNQITASGKDGNSTVSVSGDVRATGATAKLSGSINGKPLNSTATVRK